METYKRQVKFCYYKVAELFIAENGDKSLGGNFNLVDWLMKVQRDGKIKRNVKLSDCIVNLEQIHYDKANDLYIIRAFKLRDANVPSIVKDGKDSISIPLEDDEYIGEDINFLYDRQKSICMFQQNRQSISISRLQEWINADMSTMTKEIVFYPILNAFTKNTITGKQVRTLEFSFANMEPMDDCGTLGSIINSVGKFKGYTGKVTVSVGRLRDAELDQENVLEFVSEIQEARGIVSDAKIKVKGAKVFDDDKPRIEVVDLFENSFHSFIEFDVEKKKPLDFTQVIDRVTAVYLTHRSDVSRKCQW